jgi:hypothetical protein
MLTKLLNFTAAKMTEKYDKKYQTFKDCGMLISTFLDKKKEKLENGSYFLKIKELYSILELYEHFDHIFDYIKSRLKAIKKIYDSSDQFQNLLNNLQDSIKDNEDKYAKMIREYEATIHSFEDLNSILKDLNEIDSEIKNRLVK